LGNYIGIDEAPEAMFEKCMKVPDALLTDYFRLTSDIGSEVFGELLARDVREAHFALARAIVRLYRGEEAVAPAEARYREIAAGGMPEDIETVVFPGKSANLIELVRAAGFASSNSEARRLIEGGGVRLDGETARDPLLAVTGKGEVVLQRGKNRFIKMIFAP
jgi:tyrosyl-tRNA synthetase